LNSTKHTTYIWSCEFDNSSGEGLLANEFVKYYSKSNINSKIILETPYVKYFISKGKIVKKLNLKKKVLLCYKYFTPFIGVAKIIRQNYIANSVIYLNYLPIWNFLLFLLLPAKTILGPITGSDTKININSIKQIIRYILLPIFTFFSKKILQIKFRNIIFSTNLIKDINLINYIKNFSLIYILSRNTRREVFKDIDLIYYFRNHSNKFLKEEIYLLHKLLQLKFKILFCGDTMNYFNKLRIISLGYVPEVKLSSLLDRCRFVIAPAENPHSFYIQKSILSNVHVIFRKSQKKFIKNIYKSYSVVDFNKKNILKSFIKILNNKSIPSKLLNKNNLYKKITNFLIYYFSSEKNLNSKQIK
jgi:hypothetical protein